jgi:hypothetical protein
MRLRRFAGIWPRAYAVTARLVDCEVAVELELLLVYPKSPAEDIDR